MISIEKDNINELQLSLFQHLYASGEIIDVRGNFTKELHPVSIILANPRNRLTTLEERGWNLPFALGEMAWHLKGSNDFDFISYYSRNWTLALEQGEATIRESCYGSQIFSGEFSIWERLINEFEDDINTRRAVINLYDSKNSLGLNKKDVACTTSMQFLVRNNQLDCIVNMRSNDLIWGLPNDIFFATIIQELLSLILGVKLGKYYHFVGSLHIYERHFKLMDSILKNQKYFQMEMPPMEDTDLIRKFLDHEQMIREGVAIGNNQMNGYWGEFLDILLLRSNYISDELKDKICKNSRYSEVLKLCPTNYIFSETSIVENSIFYLQ